MRKLVVAFIVILLAVASSPAYAAPPPPYINIIQNPDFDLMFSNWNSTGTSSDFVWDVVDGVMHYYVLTGARRFYQATGYSASINDRYEVQVDLGNSSGVVKTVSVGLENADGSNAVACTWNIPANAGLHTYRLRVLAPVAWTDIRFRIVLQTADSLPALLIDNVSVKYVPGAQFSSTICTPPATPTPTHTPTPTPTPTPDFFIEFDLGDNQYARVERTVSGGDYVIIVLLSVFLFGSAGISLLRELRGGKS